MKRNGTTTKALSLEIEDLHQSARAAASPEAAVEFAVKAREKSAVLLRKTNKDAENYNDVKTGYALCLLRLGIRFRDVGNLMQAEQNLLEALELYKSLDDQTYIMHTLHSLGMTYWRQLKKNESLETLLQALSLAEKNIAVNAIAPGWIHTTNDALREIDHEQHPSKRVGTPEDIANACQF